MTILEEKKEISHLFLNDGTLIEGAPFKTIQPYQYADMAMVTWFEVRCKDNGLQQRINSAHVRQIIYNF